MAFFYGRNLTFDEVQAPANGPCELRAQGHLFFLQKQAIFAERRFSGIFAPLRMTNFFDESAFQWRPERWVDVGKDAVLFFDRSKRDILIL